MTSTTERDAQKALEDGDFEKSFKIYLELFNAVKDKETELEKEIKALHGEMDELKIKANNWDNMLKVGGVKRFRAACDEQGLCRCGPVWWECKGWRRGDKTSGDTAKDAVEKAIKQRPQPS